jgi:hypothetical protein
MKNITTFKAAYFYASILIYLVCFMEQFFRRDESLIFNGLFWKIRDST